ncbi:NAD(P)/FAD-dependent oxidoreductase [Propionibacterium australiense]|uniref:NADH:ubiquinone reductase (non-electrogenic) n=1 Tax=Propionibacterium australiense TaxID=119981 RepID=A0A383S3K8_9ACTN|nr:NAD(P)/FAD-dependent oxidoreductase [Propionibacterium australiense]RLP12004.1 NAD(P)/FAD-dependent oxidoreductase [Propionibacterium australiense]RLP12641.1 NAD(P)/FAD-dependent oxidoreductase [Propionibacterium australiense]SYZ32527.1 Pyridine nucleotide disulphide reductase class-I signature [Propionibacterium australiense]VEH91722.1 NADH dehydrogenase-like protein SAV0941 [Propionibacterium australiense]
MNIPSIFRTTDDPFEPGQGPRVVIVGGGFGGTNAARVLGKAGARVVIVDKNPYTTFQPLLYQVATGGLNPGDVTYRLRSFAARTPNCRFRRAKVTGVDFEGRRVECDNGGPIDYDYLIFAQGVGANYFGTPGAEEHAYTIYTRTDSVRTRDVILSNLEALDTNPQKNFDVIVVGGGPTGVEMAGTLAEMKSVGIPAIFPDVAIDRVHVTLVEMAEHLLMPFDARLRHYTRRQLHRRGVDVRTTTAIAEIREDSVLLKDGSTLPADLVIWAAGVGAHKDVAQWGMELGRGGRILVGPDLRVKGQDRVFAIGDGALIEDNPLPQLAQPAMQEGVWAARQIINLEAGRRTEKFSYFDKGTMATIGRNAAVVQMARFHGLKIDFTGFVAWIAWVALHLYFLLGGRNRLQSMINLAARYLTFSKQASGIIGDIVDERPDAAGAGDAARSKSD